MLLQYKKYSFSRILGWSSSRYETFDKCKRKYFYTYYSKHAKDIPGYKINKLKSLTSVPLEIGNIVHDIIEAFLKRLQKSSSDIDENRFFSFAREKTDEYFSKKTFLEIYYHQIDNIDYEAVKNKIDKCLQNFIESPIYNWIFMKAITNNQNWMIEPEGYGETRLDGLKAYCKMDFLFPVDGLVYILDWKTGKKNTYKHGLQLTGYAAAASSNLEKNIDIIFPKIVYLYPEFEELEIPISREKIDEFIKTVRDQTDQMYSYCSNIEENIPLSHEQFPMQPSPGMCSNCFFQELCFPDIHKKTGAESSGKEFF